MQRSVIKPELELLNKQHFEKMVKSLLDIIVLAKMNGTPIHGYQIIADIHRTFGVLLSPGTLYPLLYHLEDKKLVSSIVSGRKKLYTLTSLGRKRLEYISGCYQKNSKKIFSYIVSYLTNNEDMILGYDAKIINNI